LPVQIVELDRSMAVGAVPDRHATLYRSVIGVCDALELEVIAEGIETGAQAETVFLAGCRLAQGHLLGRPAHQPTSARHRRRRTDSPTAATVSEANTPSSRRIPRTLAPHERYGLPSEQPFTTPDPP
jgi:EAL domain-containing protein (putative c-di-GMP-specific phosphodiesterase class I)